MKYRVILAAIVFGLVLTWLYEKIQYPLPEGGVLLAKKGNLMWYNKPALSATEDHIFTGWMTSDRKVFVGVLDKTSGELLSSKELHQWRYLDDHGAPIVHVIQQGDYKGKIISIYSLHNSEIYFQRSLKSEDIAEWESKKVIANCECTYPSLLELNNVLYLFYRKQVNTEPKTRGYFMKASTDYGDTWGEEKEIVKAEEGQWIYAMVAASKQNEIHLAWGVYYPDFADIQNIFYAKSEDSGVSWSGLKNNAKYSQLDSKAEFLIHTSKPQVATRLWDLRVDESGHPVLLSVDYDSEKVLAYWMKYMNKQWIEIKLGENSREYYPCGLVFKGDSTNQVYITREQANKVSSIDEISINSDARSYTPVRHIQNESEYGYCRPASDNTYGNLVFTAVKSYPNYRKFDTWLIGMPGI